MEKKKNKDFWFNAYIQEMKNSKHDFDKKTMDLLKNLFNYAFDKGVEFEKQDNHEKS